MKKILIMGGGTAGWLAAAYLAARFADNSALALQITLVDSDDIPPIGVGEATTPSIRATLADIGFNEFDIMQMTDATFKHGILFNSWSDANSNDEYFHPFERPLRAGTDGLEQYWLNGTDPYQRKFEDAVGIQHRVARHNLAPKTLQDKQYDAPMPYAYHLDAGKLAIALKKAAITRGVEHIKGKVTHVSCNANGEIDHLTLASNQTLTADLFIDCSGFKGMLINKLKPNDFNDYSDVLFCDRAVTVQVPHQGSKATAPYTRSTATKTGWIWDIGLNSRRGVGCVYSSRYIDEQGALKQLADYLGVEKIDTARGLEFKVGFRENQWQKNCIALGLSSGFIEPLESTGIHLIEQSIWALVSLLPRYFNQAQCQSDYNQFMAEHYQHAIHFVKFHYMLSQRADSQFWLDNRHTDSWTDWLKDKYSLWQAGAPDVYDMTNLHTIFDHASYQYVYFGMHQKPVDQAVSLRRAAFAKSIFENTHKAYEKAKQVLPDHNAILAHIHNANPQTYSFESQRQMNAKVNASIRVTPNNYKASL